MGKDTPMKQILVIATGGTIACRSTEKGLMPQIEMEDFLNYVPKIREMCCLHAVQLMNLDSTNMQPENWIAIADTIHKEYDRYDGVYRGGAFLSDPEQQETDRADRRAETDQ